jgi:tetratricopeptide (TPR) repeat protein
MRKKKLSKILVSMISVVACVASAHAQHSVEVQKLSAEGEHLKAVTMFELLPSKKIVSETKIAAAKSMWALGLNRQAAEAFDSILRDGELAPDTRVRIVLSRGVIEYQEERYQEATLYAEKAIGYMGESSPLRGRAFLLWGQSLMRTAAYASAHEKFLKALTDVQGSDKAEVNFALGLVEMKLGQYVDAQKHLEAIPMDHERTAVAIRMLAGLSLETHQQARAKFWIDKGKAEYPEAFIDSWGEYGLVQVALAQGNLDEARRISELAQKRYAPSDAWLVLMQAAVEQAEWKRYETTLVG